MLVDARVSLLLGQQVRWNAQNQPVSDAEFDLIANRLHKLGAIGTLSISTARREPFSGFRQWSADCFEHLR